MDLFFHSDFVRFFLRRCALVLRLVAPGDFFLVGVRDAEREQSTGVPR